MGDARADFVDALDDPLDPKGLDDPLDVGGFAATVETGGFDGVTGFAEWAGCLSPRSVGRVIRDALDLPLAFDVALAAVYLEGPCRDAVPAPG